MSTTTNPVSDFAAGRYPRASEWQGWSDALQALTDPWTTYTPTLGASGGSPAIGSGGILTGRYYQAYKKVGFEIQLTCGGSGLSFGTGGVTLTLPVAVKTSLNRTFDGLFYDSSGSANYPILGLVSGSTLFLRQWPSTAGNPLALFTGTSPVTVASGDTIEMWGEYETS